MSARPYPIFERVRSLALPAGDYAIFGSGPLIVRGVIEPTNDLDILSRGEAWLRAQQLGDLIYLPDFEVDIVSCFDGAITIGTRWAIGEFDVDDLIDTAEVINGLPFVRLEHVVHYKQIAGRPKDRAHLQRLEATQRSQFRKQPGSSEPQPGW